MDLLIILIVISSIFGSLALLGPHLPIKVCAICAGVSLSWLALLALFLAGRFDNIALLALLMGQSITGIYYLVEKRARRSLLIFRLPFLLTLTVLFYGLLQPLPVAAIGFVTALWAVFLIIYKRHLGRNTKKLVHRFSDCCR